MRRAHRLALVVPAIVLAPALGAQAMWQVASPPQSPPVSRDWAAAFDEVRGEALLMFPEVGPSNTGWRWDGTTWSQLAGPLPANRFRCYTVYDVARDCILLWGGVIPGTAGGQFYGDFWEWNGTVWTQRPAAMPPGRSGAAVAYDRARGVTVMFGGYGQSLMQDTWEWNGVAWSNPNPSVRPSPREGATMAFDPVSNRVLMYGGSGTVETWSWNGVVWQQHLGLTPPAIRLRQSMVTDVKRARIVLFGGTPFDAWTYEWDGSQWHMSMPGTPGPIQGAACVYDTQRSLVLLHGGESWVVGNTNLTWTYRTPLLAAVAPFGSGCAGTAGTPALASAPYVLPWLGDTMRNVVQTIPAGEPGVIFVSSSSTTPPIPLGGVGMPGCDLLVPLDVLDFRPAAAGRAEWALTIPNTPSLAAVSFRQQAFVFDAAANTLGLVASNAVIVTTGVR